jgi:hypothetical protein
VTPACLRKMSSGEGRASRAENREVVSPPLLPPHPPLHPPSRIQAQRGVFSPRALDAVRATLQAHLICLCAHNCSLSAQFASRLTASSGKVTPRRALRAHMRARSMWIRVLISVSPNSSEKGQSRQLGPRYIHMVITCRLKKVRRRSTPISPSCTNC